MAEAVVAAAVAGVLVDADERALLIVLVFWLDARALVAVELAGVVGAPVATADVAVLGEAVLAADEPVVAGTAVAGGLLAAVLLTAVLAAVVAALAAVVTLPVGPAPPTVEGDAAVEPFAEQAASSKTRTSGSARHGPGGGPRRTRWRTVVSVL